MIRTLLSRLAAIPVAAILIAAHPVLVRSAEPDPRQFPNRAPILIAQVVAYVVTLEKCALIKPGRDARLPWNAIRAEYRDLPERWARDEPALKSYLRAEIGRQRLSMPEPAEGWCPAARRAYGTRGQIFPDAIAMRDGSFSGAPARPDPLEIHHD